MSTDCTPRAGAQIRQSAGISTAYHEGRGSVIMRGTVAIEEDDASRGRKGRGSRSSGGPAIVITELPYQTNKATLPAASLSSWAGGARPALRVPSHFTAGAKSLVGASAHPSH